MLELVRKHGWNATAFQTLERGYAYFFHGSDACVAYVDTGGGWVAAGAPIAASGELRSVALAFVESARAAGKRAAFFATEQRFRDALGDELEYLSIGEQPVWDPCDWAKIVSEHRSLREQLRRARAKGVVVRELSPEELAQDGTRAEIAETAESWLNTRAMAPMAFLVQLEVFDFAHERRCFAAELDGRIVGFAGVVPVPARGGWMLEDLVRDPRAPNGTSELLVDQVMRWAADAGARWLTLGLAPLAGDVNGVLRAVRDRSKPLYDFDGLRAYKAKLRPHAWTRIELAYPHDQSWLSSLYDVLAAFTGSGFLRFGWRTLKRTRVAKRALVTLLVLLLAIALVLAFK